MLYEVITPLLARHFIVGASRELGQPEPMLPDDTMSVLLTHPVAADREVRSNCATSCSIWRISSSLRSAAVFRLSRSSADRAWSRNNFV